MYMKYANYDSSNILKLSKVTKTFKEKQNDVMTFSLLYSLNAVFDISENKINLET
jgi:hypothetical protein